MKTIKKIISLGFGVLMVGATLTGALASGLSLSDYPSMFLDENNNFNGVLVVGADAKAEDVIGITNIATSLQQSAVNKTTVQTSETASVTEGYELCNHNLYLGTSIAECEPSIDDVDLDLLADELYHDAEGENDNDEKYTQQILFSDTNTGNFVFTQDDDDAPVANGYLFIDNTHHYLYKYKLQFDSGVTVDSEQYGDDLEGTELKIQDTTFVITDVKVSGSQITQIEAQSGDTTVWLSEGETVTRTIDGVEHDIELVDVDADASSNGGSCGFKIDGTTVWVDVKDTEMVNGVSLGVIDAKRVNIEAQNQDVCEVAIGSEKLTIVNDNEMKINNENVDGTHCDIDSKADGSDINFKGFDISWASENPEIYMNAGDEFIDPIFGNFKFVFAGVETRGTEQILFNVGGSDGSVMFSNEDGTLVELPVAASGNTQSGEATNEPVYFGNEAPVGSSANQDELVYLEGETCTGVTNVVDCQGAMFLVVEPVKAEAHLVQITNIDINDNEINFDDLTYGTSDDDVSYTDGSESSIELKSAGNIKLLINESAKTVLFSDIGSEDGAEIKTENRAVLEVVNGDTDSQVFEGIGFNEFDDGSLPDSDYVSDMYVEIVYDDSVDNNLEVLQDSVDVLDSSYGYGFFDESEDDSDYKVFMTNKGSLVTYDQKDNQYLSIEHPYDTAYASVYISPTEAEVSDGSVVQTVVNPIEVSSVKLDSEIEDVQAQNLILVGGSCANSVVAELMGNPSDCTKMGIKSGQALIKLFENGEYVALVVAGQDAMDTRLASEILANWEDYDLSGDEIVATTVSHSSLEVEEIN